MGEDTNGTWDIFVHDWQAGQTTRVSVASDGSEANGWSSVPSISADGRYVAFDSGAQNLASGKTNSAPDVFVHDRQTGQTTWVSAALDGTQGNGQSEYPSISANGRFVAFASYASNLVSGDTNGAPDVFVHDRQASKTTRASVTLDGTQGNDWSLFPSISGDGRFVAFESSASNLVSGDTNGTRDVFVYVRQTGQTTRVSVASDGTQGNGWSARPSISADGRFVAFASQASNLVSGDTNNSFKIFVHDRQTGQTTCVSVTSGGTQGIGDSYWPLISAEGRFVAFHSPAGGLVSGDTNSSYDVFVHDRQTGQTTRVSVASDGTQGNGDSGRDGYAISADGRFVAFESRASNLVPGDTNGTRDVFVHDRCPDGSCGSPPIPFLDLPFDYSYSNFGTVAQGNIGGLGPGRVNSWFDHQYPTYDRSPNRENPGLKRWDGEFFPNPPRIGEGWYDGHNGVDFQRRNPDDLVFAAAPGTVFNLTTSCQEGYRDCGDGYGNQVWINHHNGYATLYGHLKTVFVSSGTEITDPASQPLGITGNTGRSDGPHLHFGLYYDQNGDGQWTENKVVDPYGWAGAGSDPWSVPSRYLWKYPLWTRESAGSAGTSLSSPSGNVNATIPPGALTSTVTLELWDTPPAAGHSAQLRPTGHSFWLRVLEWLPGGSGPQSTTQFPLIQPITLTVTYTDADVLHLDAAQLALYRWDEGQETWQPLSTTVDPDNRVATAQTQDLGEFDLQSPLLCPTDDLEPDDGYPAARWVWPNDWPLARGLDISQDSDWARFDAVQGARYTLRTQNLAGGANTVLNLYDVDALTLLASNDDAGGGPASELVWTAPYTGTFFVEVVSAPSGITGCSATYELTIATTPGDVIADCRVDVADLQAVASRWRLSAANPDPDGNVTTPNYETRFDLDRDGDGDIVDVLRVAARWGERCP